MSKETKRCGRQLQRLVSRRVEADTTSAYMAGFQRGYDKANEAMKPKWDEQEVNRCNAVNEMMRTSYELAQAKSALRIIRTWADFDGGRCLCPPLVLEQCDKGLEPLKEGRGHAIK